MNVESKSQALAQASWILGATFLLLLAILHLLKPEFDPSWRMISEYEIGQFAWLMRLAFFCWGGGFLLLTISLWNTLQTISGNIGKWWLFIISIALFGAGIFAPQPITDIVRGTTDKIHGICGAIMIFTFPIVSTIIALNLSKQPENIFFRKQIFWVTIFVWIGIIVFFSSMIVYSEQAKARAYSAEVLIGFPNRLMVVAYTIWLITIARLLKSRGDK